MSRALFLSPAPTPMRVECAWCKLVMREGREPVSHGICDDCKARVIEEARADHEAREGAR